MNGSYNLYPQRLFDAHIGGFSHKRVEMKKQKEQNFFFLSGFTCSGFVPVHLGPTTAWEPSTASFAFFKFFA